MFSVDLSTSECDGLTVATLRGELDVVDAASVAAVLLAAADSARVVIADLSGLEFIDSSGVAALANAARHARRVGSDLLLAAPQQQILRVLAATGLHRYVPARPPERRPVIPRTLLNNRVADGVSAGCLFDYCGIIFYAG